MNERIKEYELMTAQDIVKRMKMKVYASRTKNLCHEMTPIVIETNLSWAIPYWTRRKMINPKIFWEIV
jgi:hypothetical protein